MSKYIMSIVCVVVNVFLMYYFAIEKNALYCILCGVITNIIITVNLFAFIRYEHRKMVREIRDSLMLRGY